MLYSPNQNDTARSILEAAAALFLQKGYRKVTTREIAAAANVNLGLIPYYFTSKENLAASVMRDFNDQAYAVVFRRLPQGLGCAERLYLSTQLLWQQFSEDAMNFFIEYLEVCGYTRVSETFEHMAAEVLDCYALSVPSAQHALYLHALKGAESRLLIGLHRGQLQTSFGEITRIILTKYFFNIGLTSGQIDNILDGCRSYLDGQNQTI